VVAALSVGLAAGVAEAAPVWSGAAVLGAEVSVGATVGASLGELVGRLDAFVDGVLEGFVDGFEEGLAVADALGAVVGVLACAVAGTPGAVLDPLCHAKATYPPSGTVRDAAPNEE
jgi:hypothetical protein